MVEPEVLSAALTAQSFAIGSNYILNSGWTDGNAIQRLEEHLGSVHNSLSSLEEANEEISTGARRNGRMSVVRRFFCLFVLFDLLLISLVWLLCIMLMSGDKLVEILKMQIVYCNITTSLFDIVLTASCRFTVLLLFYGLLHLNTTFFVAFTTLGTCVFLIFKVVYYSWSTASQPALQVTLVLISFVVAWAETWFLDFRVLPQELSALNYFQTTSRLSERLGTLPLDRSLRGPVMRNFLRDMASEIGGPPESTGNFYSPLESPDDSGDEAGDLEKKKHGKVGEYLRRGRDTLEVAWSILNDCDWNLQKETPEGDRVYSKHEAHLGKVFLLRAKMDIQARRLLDELFSNVERFALWNKTLLESRRVEVVDERTDITYQVSAPGGNGGISSRDFVSLRHWDVRGDAFVLAAISISHPSLPPCRKYVRGENGPCCWAMTPLRGDEGSCHFEFLLNTNLKGWIPSKVVEAALTSVLLEYTASLREHCRALNGLANT